jgi:hypothetical protein
LEGSKSLVLQVGVLTCRWHRHSVKTFLLAETQLRLVVPIEEEEDYLYVMLYKLRYWHMKERNI